MLIKINIHVTRGQPEIKMASFVESEVEIQDVGDVQIQEVEVEHIQVEMPIETVETSDETIESQPMIALQPMPEVSHQEEVIYQTAGEEVVGDPNLVYVDTIPDTSEIEISTADVFPISSRKGKTPKKRQQLGIGRVKLEGESSISEFFIDPSMTPRRWEQKQVQIKTLEGEFSVTMWASGEYFILNDSRYTRGAFETVSGIYNS